MCPAIMNGISCLSLSVFPLLPLSPVAHPVWRASVCDTLTDQKDLDICLPRPVNARSTSTLCSVTFSVKQAVLPTLPTPPHLLLWISHPYIKSWPLESYIEFAGLMPTCGLGVIGIRVCHCCDLHCMNLTVESPTYPPTHCTAVSSGFPPESCP